MLMIIITTIRTGDIATMLIATIYQHQKGHNKAIPINSTQNRIITIATTNIVTTITTISTIEIPSANPE